MSKINVLVLITVMDRAGAETMMMNYLRNINRDKIHMDFLINREQRSDYEDEIEQLGSKVYHMCALYPGKFRRYKREFKTFLTEHPQYDIIHSNLEERSYYALRIAKKMGIPVRIAHAHSAPSGRNLKMIMRLYFRKRLQKYCTHKVACGEKAAKWLFGEAVNVVSVKEYIRSERGKQYTGENQRHRGNTVLIMKNAIDTKKFLYAEKARKQIRKKLKIKDSTLVIGHVGRFTSDKNQSFLVEVLRNVNNMNKDCLLLLIGGGRPKEEIKYKEEVQLKVRKLGLGDKVKFLGVRDDINKIMQGMDIFAMPSVSEGFPVTLVEAQAAGLRCLVSDGVCYDVNLTEEIQYKSLAESSREWGGKLLSMVRAEESISVEHRIKMNEKVKEKGYDIRDNARWLEEFYETILHG